MTPEQPDHERGRASEYLKWRESLNHDPSWGEFSKREEAIAFASFLAGWFLRAGENPNEFWNPPTEKITTKDQVNTTESVSPTSPATEESSATDHFRDATKMVSGESSAVVKDSFTTQPQPISTAPKGKRILLYCPRKVQSEGWWQVGTFDEETCRWIDDDYEPGCMLVQPTYWLPWPAHPTQTQPNP